jgi:hypothetical protein
LVAVAAVSSKPQAASRKPQAASRKPQATAAVVVVANTHLTNTQLRSRTRYLNLTCSPPPRTCARTRCS